MRYLLLLAHDPSQPLPSHWNQKLQNLLQQYDVQTVLSGSAQLAQRVGVQADEINDFFDETVGERDGSADAEQFFSQPTQISVGDESAYAARGRFAAGLFETVDEIPNGGIAIVTGRRLLALFLASCYGISPLDQWRSLTALEAPYGAVLTLPDLQPLSVASLR